ncbi:endonuclease/exonuclease/phosphatase family protein [Chitinasiproducens palmae]|uniref:Metal-dependent hydrolase, endonuclease/exonuclease/phosphatase family n=1 Tax=Chitinasiproducens palmae TaxID=1770053 RepID=A0A1H2PM20_9BURK|nr:endonuclease/exonuclease/phosphatase family protein [Chitinasiproducens palmae]SDV47581.1 Metal-dependent hydrolase, endonuclease/exonuclease/phosphatase family [Chitinasiproducens palmae]
MIELDETIDSQAVLPGDADDRALRRSEARRPWPLKIVTYNIHGAVGRDRQLAPARIAAVLEEIDADVVALQEVPLGGSDAPNVLAYLAEATGFHSVAGVTMSSPQRLYGNAVLSRHPIVASRAIDLSFGTREPRGALDADIDCDGHLLRVVATHLGLSAAERRRQVEQLLESFETPAMPVVLVGDLNEWFLWGRALRRLVAHFKRVPAPLTFPSRLPVFALDRVWVSPAKRLVRVSVHKTRAARIASDHLPLVAQIDA